MTDLIQAIALLFLALCAYLHHAALRRVGKRLRQLEEADSE